ncbi:E3 ubiquitin-protein ligase amfr-like [Balamuthia mandrillaris]
MISLRTYTSLSVLCTAVCVAQAYAHTNTFPQLVAYMTSSKTTVLVLTNMAYNLLFLLGKLVQVTFFGKLRAEETRQLYDRLLKYILFKIVFVGAILEIPRLRELFLWVAWFSVLGFFRTFSLLARDRYEYLVNHAPSTRLAAHLRVIGLLVAIIVADISWFLLCLFSFGTSGLSIIFLMTFECFTLFLDTLQTLIKYAIHLHDLRNDTLWEEKTTYIYYTEFITDSLVLMATLIHYIHILFLHGVSFTLIDFVLFLHMKVVFHSLHKKIVNHRNYRRLSSDINDRYPSPTEEELIDYDDNCAICLSPLSTTAKKLPCGHIFHSPCMRTWLERHHSCPTCRQSLRQDQSTSASSSTTNSTDTADNSATRAMPATVSLSADGAMPSSTSAAPSSISTRPVNNVHTLPQYQQMPMNNEGGIFGVAGAQWLPFLQLMQPFVVPEEWIFLVQNVFPDVQPDDIRRDLARTRSVDITINNILEGYLPRGYVDSATFPSSTSFTTTTSSSSSSSSSSASTFPSPSDNAGEELQLEEEEEEEGNASQATREN